MAHTILVIGGEQTERTLLCRTISDKLSYRAWGMESETELGIYLAQEYAPKPDIIVYDISKTYAPGEKISILKKQLPSIPVIALARYGNYEGAMASINAGAQDFLMKPAAIERIKITFHNTLLLRDLYQANTNTSTSNVSFSLLNEDGNVRRIYDLEKEAIAKAIAHYNGRMSEAARRLGIGRSTLYRKLNGQKKMENASLRPSAELVL